MKTFKITSELIKSFGNKIEDLALLANIHRINCLAGLKDANHGWLGACFSSMELLTCIYHRYITNPLVSNFERGSVYLSKGHAAMAQYAVLADIGVLSLDSLETYKKLNGLPAHCDRNINGVDCDSGSLGMGLSKAIGTAISNRDSNKKVPVFVIIGDGELQEGQVFESLLSLKKYNPGQIVPIIDRNYLQSDSITSDIKDAKCWAKVFEGIGLKVKEIDGHSVEQICKAIDETLSDTEPTIIIASTTKGYGTSISSMTADTPRRQGVWHGQIPNDSQYLEMVEELVAKINNADLKKSFDDYKKLFLDSRKDESKEKVVKSEIKSTGQAFADALFELGYNDKDIYVLDADLEKSCKLTKVAETFSNRYIEVGISEQDMCSIAAGLALTGKIPVVNTYSSFYKRSLDQIFSIVTEKLPVIFAGHYSGIDYYTDGKSHQSIIDIGLMRSLGEIEILEPVDEETTSQMLEATISRMKKEFAETGHSKPTFIRLHRTPCNEDFGIPYCFDNVGIYKSELEDTENRCIVFTSGPHMLSLALDAIDKLYDVIPVLRYSDENKFLKNAIARYRYVFCFEDHRRETGLGGFIASLGFKNPVRVGCRTYAQSTRTLEDMLNYHKLSSEELCSVIRKVTSCKDHK
jgi:transketolase